LFPYATFAFCNWNKIYYIRACARLSFCSWRCSNFGACTPNTSFSINYLGAYDINRLAEILYTKNYKLATIP